MSTSHPTSSDKAKSSTAAENSTNSANAIERKASKRLSIIWVIPILALILTGMLVWKNTFDQGPIITLNIMSADGIEAGKTLVKFRSVKVGMVQDVRLSPDYSRTILTIQMDKDTDEMLSEDTKFWIVKPRIEHTGISGLDTLLSGSYIEMALGDSSNFSSEFTALDKPPVNQFSEDGINIKLYSAGSKRLSVGETVTFRGFDVGMIADASFDMGKKKILYKVFIREPYSQLINESTKFWVSSGIDVSFNASGLSLNTDSLDNMISGGVSFDQFMPLEKELTPAKEGDVYELYLKHEEARIAALSEGLLYVIMLDKSLGQLSPGAGVSFNGIKVGEVVKAPWFDDYSSVFASQTLPVLFAISTYDFDLHEVKGLIDSYIDSHRLCAKIDSSNILLGQNKIDLQIDADGKCKIKPEFEKLQSAEMHNGVLTYRGKKVVPIMAGKSITDQLSAFAQQLNSIDLPGISADLRSSMQAFTVAMEAFTTSNNALEQTQAVEKMAAAFENFDRMVRSYGETSQIYKSLNQSLSTVERLLKDIAPAVKEMGQNPSSLLFGGADDPLPRTQTSKK